MMKVDRQNRTHHGVSGWTKQAFEFRRCGCSDLSAEAKAGCIYKPVVIGLADVDWHCLTFDTERQSFRWITRNIASNREIIRGAKRHYSQYGSRNRGETHQTVKNLIQCAVPTRSNHQIRFACFRNKSPRISLFPSHSHLDAMAGCPLPGNRRAQEIVPGDFPIKNYAKPFDPWFNFHRDGRGA
jgi:hypothetical protein